MVERIPPNPEPRPFDRGSWVRLRADAPSRTRSPEYAPLGDHAYVVCWRNEPGEYRPEQRYMISEPITAEVMDRIKKAESEIEAQQILIGAGRVAYYIDASEIESGQHASPY